MKLFKVRAVMLMLSSVLMFLGVTALIIRGTLNSSMWEYYLLSIVNALLFVRGYILWEEKK